MDHTELALSTRPGGLTRWISRLRGFGLGMAASLGLGLSILSQGGGSPVNYSGAQMQAPAIDRDWPPKLSTFTFASG
jgi:hypothetical protein